MNRAATTVLAACLLSLAAPLRAGGQCASCVQASFGPAARAFPTGSVSKFAARGDFNGDGIVDVAVDGGGLAVLLGTGAGRFGPASYFPYADPRYIAVADFDRDGNQDLAIAAEGNIYVLLGDGVGGFVESWHAPDPIYAERIYVGDFDGDGLPDLVTNAWQSHQLAELRGLGDGTFAFARAFLVGPDVGGEIDASVGDLDGDGIDDLVADNKNSGDAASFLGSLGNGLVRVHDFSLGDGGGELFVRDFDENGVPDLLAVTGSMYTGNALVVMPGNGDGTFQAGAPFYAGYGIPAAVGDLTGEGHLDVALFKAWDTQSYGVLVYPGTGGGTFADPVNTILPGEAHMLVAADVDGDGMDDLVFPTWERGSVEILRSAGGGHFEEAPRYSAGITSLTYVAVGGDFNGDSLPDVAVGGGLGTVRVVPGRIGGGFGDPLDGANGLMFGALVAGDFTGDGALDLVYQNYYDTLYFAKGVGDGTFDAPVSMAMPFGNATLAAGDFRGNGELDLLLRLDDGSLRDYPGNGDGTFASPSTLSSNAIDVVAGHVDAGGSLDVAYTSGTYDARFLRVRLGNGAGGFGSEVSTSIPGSAGAFALADLDGNGKTDAVLSVQDNVAVLLGDGSGSFGAAVLYPLPGWLGRPVVADVSGDGIPDVVVPRSGDLAVLTGVGDGTLRPANLFALPGYAVTAVTADYDQDGRTDVAVACEGSVYTPPNFVALLTNTSCDPRRLLVPQQPAACGAAGAPFAVQPVVDVVDDGGNVVCDGGTVSASIVPGTGTPGASLTGVTQVASANGTATFSNLAIDLNGAGYRLAFSHPDALPASSAAVSQGLSASIAGPSSFCPFPPAHFQATGGPFEEYVWTLDGTPFAWSSSADLEAPPAGDHTLALHAVLAGCRLSASLPIHVSAFPSAPAITAAENAPVGATGLTGSVVAQAGHSYSWELDGGTITGGANQPVVTFDAGAPGVRMVLRAVDSLDGGCSSPESEVPVQVDFVDVPPSHMFHDAVVTIALSRITAGCASPGAYCPTAPVTRAQMAVFLLKSELGADYLPPPCAGNYFYDVPCNGNPFDPWIEDLARRQITSGCGGGFNFCPTDPVTRAQMAVFLLRTDLGAFYQPPACTGTVFGDVPCTGGSFDPWIEDLAARGITGGCSSSPALYCPTTSVNRGQMAVFLMRTFSIS
jgi:hypothetical protein